MRWIEVPSSASVGVPYSVAAEVDDGPVRSVRLLARADGNEGSEFCFAWTMRGRLYEGDFLRKSGALDGKLWYDGMSAPRQASFLFSMCFPERSRPGLQKECADDPAWTELLVEASQLELSISVLDS